MSSALFEQLQADLDHHLPGRGWHELIAPNRVETYHTIVTVLGVLGYDATIMSSARGDDGFYFYIAAVPDDDTAPDYKAARELLSRMKRVEQVDRELTVSQPDKDQVDDRAPDELAEISAPAGNAGSGMGSDGVDVHSSKRSDRRV